MDVRLHHHREQGPVDATSPLEHRREKRPAPQLRDRELHITRLRRQQPGSMPVAQIRTRRRPLIRARADHLGRFDFDQRLEHQLHALTDDVEITPRAERVKQFRQVRMGQGHRRVLLRVPGKVTPSITPVAHQTVDPYADLHHLTGRPPSSRTRHFDANCSRRYAIASPELGSLVTLRQDIANLQNTPDPIGVVQKRCPPTQSSSPSSSRPLPHDHTN